MAARPLRRAICAGAKKGATVAPAVVALQRLPRYSFALPRFCYKRGLSIRAVLLRRPFVSRSFLLCRPLTLRAFDRRFTAARKTSRFVARVKF